MGAAFVHNIGSVLPLEKKAMKTEVTQLETNGGFVSHVSAVGIAFIGPDRGYKIGKLSSVESYPRGALGINVAKKDGEGGWFCPSYF